MTSWRLTLREQPAFKLDLRGVTPDALAGLGAGEVEHLPLAHGRALTLLGEWFRVEAIDASDAQPVLQLVGDLGRVDQIGCRMTAGQLLVDGDAGDGVGTQLRGGVIRVQGRAGQGVAREMAGGELHVAGDVGDFAASTLPGSLDGMRGGLLHIRGCAGDRLADRMRRGTVIVEGDAGDFTASRLVAGTLVLGGRCGAHPAYGMRRGTLLWADPAAREATPLPSTFVPGQVDVRVFWQLLARELARLGAGSSLLRELPRRTIERHLGDLAVDGKGEVIFVR
ncbi:MAG: formylmethanofuran dehydrogenase subunit C [Leptothrix sp. (in: b-proteobacteria)]